MKQIILSIVISLMAIVVMAQTNVLRQSVNYEAASWKIWLLDNPEQITIVAPPTIAQSKTELQSIKQGMGKLNEKKLTAIKYWDAGAPSYRWNQIVLGLIDLKPEIQLRMPASWMNIAIYDATILAWKEKIKYKRKRPTDLDPSFKPTINTPLTYSYPCEHSVTAAAAAYVLVYFFPEKADSIMCRRTISK